MGWSFRKSKKLLPGVRLSLSHRGVGVRVGTKHAGVSVTPTGARVSGSIPGTGISARQQLGTRKGRKASQENTDEVEEFYLQEPSTPSFVLTVILMPIYCFGFLLFTCLGIASLCQPEVSMKALGAFLILLGLVCVRRAIKRYQAFG
jgi:hypothetical protein